MSRPFIPPSAAALHPILVLESEDGLAMAHKAGFAEGHACGLLEGRLAGQREGEARIREEAAADIASLRESLAKFEAREALSVALATLMAEREATDRALETASRAVLVSALRTLFPTLLASAGGAEVAAIVSEALAVRAPASLSLRAHPDTLAGLDGEALHGLATAPDPSLDPGAAELTWTGGGLTFNPATLLEQVEQVLSPVHPDTKDATP